MANDAYTSEFPGMRPGEDLEFTYRGHRISVGVTWPSATHTGRDTYHVTCRTCSVVIAERTTSARCSAELHVDPIVRQYAGVKIAAIRALLARANQDDGDLLDMIRAVIERLGG